MAKRKKNRSNPKKSKAPAPEAAPSAQPPVVAQAAPAQKAPEPVDAAPSEPSEPVFDGADVLWNRPGQIVLGFALMMGTVWWVQEAYFAEEAKAEGVVAELPSEVNNILAEADLDTSQGGGTVGGPKVPDQKRGLVNLYKTVTGTDEDSQPAAKPVVAKKDTNPQPTAAKPQKNGQPEKNGQPDKAEAGAKPVAQDDVKVKIEDPNGAMKAFYAALKRTEKKEKGAITRVVHWGDSVIVADMMTATARRKLQERFGDAGHGFMLVSKPWEYYIHQNVEHKASEVWRNALITKNTLKDKHYGLGGVATFGRNPVAWAEFGTTKKGNTGRKLSHFEVFYGTSPEGGNVVVELDGKEAARFSTKADSLTDKVHKIDFPDGAHKIKVRSDGGGESRFYGVVLERNEPGVVYDCLGVTGSRASTFIRFEPNHFKKQLEQRDPDMMVVMTGPNQSKFKGMDMAQYEKDYTTMIKQLRAARPQSTCLVAGSPDRADKATGQLATSPLIPKIIAVQRKVALANGCAFWNTYEAMGGEGSMIAWFRNKPRLASGDYTHLTLAGGEVLGTLFYKALMANYK